MNSFKWSRFSIIKWFTIYTVTLLGLSFLLIAVFNYWFMLGPTLAYPLIFLLLFAGFKSARININNEQINFESLSQVRMRVKWNDATKIKYKFNTVLVYAKYSKVIIRIKLYENYKDLCFKIYDEVLINKKEDILEDSFINLIIKLKSKL